MGLPEARSDGWELSQEPGKVCRDSVPFSRRNESLIVAQNEKVIQFVDNAQYSREALANCRLQYNDSDHVIPAIESRAQPVSCGDADTLLASVNDIPNNCE